MVHCNVVIYNEILFLNYHRSSYADKLPEMLLSQMAINIFWVGPIIRVQFSGWQLFGGTQQQSIILRGNSLSTNIQGLIIWGTISGLTIFWWQLSGGPINLGDNCPGDNYLGGEGGNYPGGNCLRGDKKVCGQLSGGVDYLGYNCQGGNFPGDNYPRGNCPVPVIK